MPVKKTHLSREEQARYLARAKELQAAQVDCEVPDDWQENFHDLDIFTAAPAGNIMCELSSGVTAYAIWVHLTALRSDLRLEKCEIVSTWDSESIVLCQSQRGFYLGGVHSNFLKGTSSTTGLKTGYTFITEETLLRVGWSRAVSDQFRTSIEIG